MSVLFCKYRMEMEDNKKPNIMYKAGQEVEPGVQMSLTHAKGL